MLYLVVQMNVEISENGCQDDEIKILDTRLPYFYESVKKLFVQEPPEVNVFLVDSKDTFQKFRGQVTDEGAFIRDSTIYIYQPNLFGIATTVQRKDFYKTLYQELIYLFYAANKTHN
jgi:hypothetical protein